MRMKRLLCIIVAVCLTVAFGSMITGCGNSNGDNEKADLPWENGGKQPSEYTWEEYLELNGEQQIAFQRSFGSQELFAAWMQEVNGGPESTEDEVVFIPLELPWENGGKQPEEYTWEEFLALEGGLQIEFQMSFDGEESFEEWMERVNPSETEDSEELYLPWEDGGKQPQEYTWEEFDALSDGQKLAFQHSFDDMDAFDAWYREQTGNSGETEPTEEPLPWENGGKQPEEYTWEEFQALEGAQQIAFQHSFDTADGFDKWLERVLGEETEPTEEEVRSDLPWENGGKQPEDYTWEEFEALDGAQQIAFQRSFESMEAFDEWLQRVNPQ